MKSHIFFKTFLAISLEMFFLSDVHTTTRQSNLTVFMNLKSEKYPVAQLLYRMKQLISRKKTIPTSFLPVKSLPSQMQKRLFYFIQTVKQATKSFSGMVLSMGLKKAEV